LSKKDKYIVGLDIGSTKTCVLIAEIVDEHLKFLALGAAESKGLRKGLIVNLDSAISSIRRAVEEAESVCGVPAPMRDEGATMSGVRQNAALDKTICAPKSTSTRTSRNQGRVFSVQVRCNRSRRQRCCWRGPRSGHKRTGAPSNNGSPARPTCCDCVSGKFPTLIASLRACAGKNLS